jgi:predicted enzyme related to lactoylglutathione lyase
MAVFAEGTPCWLDVSLPDLEAGRRFYGDLFGWTFPPGPGQAAYAEARSEGRRVAGLVAKRDGRMPTAWGVYFATPDAAEAARRVVAAGGRMVREPLPVGRLGVVALAADPGGAVFGLWQSAGQGPEEAPARSARQDPGEAAADPETVTEASEGPGVPEGAEADPERDGSGAASSAAGVEEVGFERQGAPGSFCWTEVYTRLPEPVDAFYERVLRVGYSDVTGLPGEAVPFRMWSPNGATPGTATAVAGRSVMTDAFPAELPGHFLNYFAVADCDATAAAVVRLGGRVRQAPFDIPYGRMAVFTDNQGAEFAVLAEPADATGEAGADRTAAAEDTAGAGAGGGAGAGAEEAATPGDAPDAGRGKWRWGKRRGQTGEATGTGGEKSGAKRRG